MKKQEFDSELVSVVAHDLKTPVSAAKGFIELVQRSGPLNDKQLHFSERAMAALERMEQLIGDLLDYARLDAGVSPNITDCDVMTLIGDAVSLVEGRAAERGITIQVEQPKTRVVVLGDNRMLKQVTTNLLSNAVKYNKDQGQVMVSVHRYKDHVRVDVRDTGIGIPSEDLPQVFERFFRSKLGTQAKIEGSGLGLAITRAIVEMHGGQIWAESVVGEGSTFSFTLPLKMSVSANNRKRRGFNLARDETPSEEPDLVSDNQQDSHDTTDSDSQGDNL